MPDQYAMNITLNITKLLQEHKITQEEYDKLLALGRGASWKQAWSVLFLMGLIAIILGTVGLFPDVFTWIQDFIRSIYLKLGRQVFHLIAFLLILGGGLLAKSGFLTGLSCFVIMSFLSGTPLYSHASRLGAIQEPAVTVLVFSLLALAGLLLSSRVSSEYERLALIFSRTSLILINLGFWVGSLWGSVSPVGYVAPWVFSVIWAAGLLCILVWGAKVGRLFVVNAAITFGAIHFYTQWFEYLRAEPAALFVGGLIGLGLAFAIPRYNRYLKQRRAAPGAPS